MSKEDSIKLLVLKTLLYQPNMQFNKLWKIVGGESNTFAYHLKKLITKELIEKRDESYSLSISGRELANSLFQGEVSLRPISSVLIVIEKNDKVLCYRRLKQPSFGYYAFPGGKIKNDEYPLETAQRKVLQDTHLICKLTLKGIFHSKTIINQDVSYNNQIYVFAGKNPTGKLQKEFYKGVHMWIHPEKIPKSKKYPEVDSLLEIITSKSFKIIEMNRYKEDDTFKEFEIISNISY